MLNKILSGLVAVLLCCCVGLKSININLTDKLDETKSELVEANLTIKTINKKAEKLNEDYIDVMQKNSKLSEQNISIRKDLERMKDRESTIAAKPKLTEKLINKSFNQFTKDVQCLTSRDGC